MTPPFQSIEIEGHTFSVLDYYEDPNANAGTYREVLVRLSPAERDDLRALFRQAGQARMSGGAALWQVKRVGIDPMPITVTPGQRNWWSRHQDSGAVFYKQIIRLLPVNTPPTDFSLAGALDMDILAETLMGLAERFEALVDALELSGAIPPTVATTLRGEWEDSPLGDAERADEIMWRNRRVGDAADVVSS